MKIIALANQKGGVAKSTSTYNLAFLKAQQNKRVLMIDLDQQASLTILCGIMPGKTEYSVCDLMTGSDPYDCGYPVEKSGLDNLYLIPSDIVLAETEQNLISKMSREKILKKQLSKFADDFDFIFIDCPPQLSLLTTNALVAATDVIVPTKAEYLSYRGLRALSNTICAIQDDLNPDLAFDGYIVTMFEKTINDQKDLLAQIEKDGPVLGVRSEERR